MCGNPYYFVVCCLFCNYFPVLQCQSHSQSGVSRVSHGSTPAEHGRKTHHTPILYYGMAIALRLTDSPLKAADRKLALLWPSLAAAAPPVHIFDFCQSFIPGCLWPGPRWEVDSPTKEAKLGVNNAWKTCSVCESVCMCVCSTDYTLHYLSALYIWDLGGKQLKVWLAGRRAIRVSSPCVSVFQRCCLSVSSGEGVCLKSFSVHILTPGLR